MTGVQTCALPIYFNVDKDYLFPKENVEEIIVTKNKKIKFQKILLICSLCLIVIGLFVGIINVVPSIASSGGMDIITAEKLTKNSTDQIKFFKYGKYEFGYKNVYKNDNDEFVLKPGGEIWSLDGMPDYLMGYYNGENTELYFYTNALNKVKVLTADNDIHFLKCFARDLLFKTNLLEALYHISNVFYYSVYWSEFMLYAFNSYRSDSEAFQ